MGATSPEEICRLFQKYMAEGDIERVLSIYEAEASFLNQSGEIRKGLEELREELAPMVVSKPTFEFNIRQVIRAGEIALMHTEWDVSVTGQKTMHVYAIEVARRQPDGTWCWLIGDPFTVGKFTSGGKK